MKNMRNYLIGAAIFVFVISGFFSFRAYTSSQNVETTYSHSIQTIQNDIRKLEAQLEELTKRIAGSGESSAEKSVSDMTQGDKFESAPLSAKNELMRLKQQVEAAGRERLKLKQILESTGLDQLAKMEDIDPDILKELYNEYAGKKEIYAHRDYLFEKNSELHQEDTIRYDEELDSLYRRARRRGRSNAIREDREKAFEEMMSKYPDAYATGMVIAERALLSAIRRNATETEKYYAMLRENENFSSVVTDRGIEAIPNIAYRLANLHIRERRTEEANLILDSLEKNYPDSLLFVRRRGRGLTWQSVSEAVPGMRSRINR